MLFESYIEGRTYAAQAKINFPKSKPSGRPGYGSVVFVLAPNRDKAIEVLEDPRLNFKQSFYKDYITDGNYNEKIGTSMVRKLERAATNSKFADMKNFQFNYVPSTTRSTILSKNKNVINDISRWMEIFFAKSGKLAYKKKCSEFIRILKGRLEDPELANYDKLLLYDLDSWDQVIKNCVIMNKKLLNNPLSILLYSAVFLPEYLAGFPDVKIMLISRSTGQLLIFKPKKIDKKTYRTLKIQMDRFKNITFSVDDETTNESDSKKLETDIDNEVKAELTDGFKKDIVRTVTKNLTLKESDVEDITDLTAEPLEGEELDSNKDLTEQLEELGVDIEDEVSKEVEASLAEVDDYEDLDAGQITLDITAKIKDKTYRASFLPNRSPAELAKIERLLGAQAEAMKSDVTIDDVKRKAIKTSTTGGFVNTKNPNIQTSKFKNFDREYTEKCLDKNISDAVTVLSAASDKIFVTSVEKKDSSDSMNLKELHTYRLVDEKGHKMTVKFDVPKVIDGTYVYLNGSKKNIRHQFILKPIVKSGTDTVQIVTAYNKVFIYRVGNVNQNINRLQVLLEKNPQKFKAVTGNCSMKNSRYEVPMDYAMLSRYFAEFTIGDIRFFMSVDALMDEWKRMTKHELKYDKNNEIPIGIDLKNREVYKLDLRYSYTEAIIALLDPKDSEEILKIKRKPKFVTAEAKMAGRTLPIILFMMFCVGFQETMKKAKIDWKFISSSDAKSLSKIYQTYDPMNWDTIPLADGTIVWKKNPFRNELLMNGFKKSDLSIYKFADLESKDTFIDLILPYYPGKQQIYYTLDNFRDFLIDPKSAEILQDMGYPTDLVDLFVVAAGMLTDTSFKAENDLNNMRVRSSEVISDLVYLAITSAYNEYRKTSSKPNPSKISIKRSEIIDKLLSANTNMIEEYSVLNPVMELQKNRSVTFRGIRGIQVDRAMTLPRRAYDKSMLGTIGITTSPDANVGIVRQLTLEPQITSTYGYIDTSKSKDAANLSAANLFTPAELLSPMGVIHDDPDRSAMSVKQAKAAVPIKDSDPVLIGNKVESITPYILTNEFIVTAEEDGKCVSVDNDFTIIEYKSGKRYAINKQPQVKKNSEGGFWIDTTLKCDLKVNSRFKEGDVLAYDAKHFTKNGEGKGASMNLGALCKIAISSQWDVFEDSAPISKRLSEKLTTEMIDEKPITLNPFVHVDKIVKIGDKVKAGDSLIVFSDAMTPELQKAMAKIREETHENVIESARTTISSKYTGEIVDIKIYTTSPVEELDPSLQKLVKEYWARIKKRNDTLDKYKNAGDLNYYKAGQIINETAEVTSPNKGGKLAGQLVNEGDVLFLFYIKYSVTASKGDKVVCSVCKGVISQVFEEGKEPYSEYRPDEPIDTIVAPLAVSARKVPTIFLTIFGNKLMIELKRQLEEIYLGK